MQTAVERRSPKPHGARLGLSGKLVLAILATGSIPIMVGLYVAYAQGNRQLQQVMGDSFQALAEDSAANVDREIQRILDESRRLARVAGSKSQVHEALAMSQPARLDWPREDQANSPTRVLRSSQVAGPEAGPLVLDVEGATDADGRPTVRVSRLLEDDQASPLPNPRVYRNRELNVSSSHRMAAPGVRCQEPLRSPYLPDSVRANRSRHADRQPGYHRELSAAAYRKPHRRSVVTRSRDP